MDLKPSQGAVIMCFGHCIGKTAIVCVVNFCQTSDICTGTGIEVIPLRAKHICIWLRANFSKPDCAPGSFW